MKHSRWLLVLFLVAGFAFTIPDADGFRERLFRQLVTWVQKLPQEKVYLHTDRDHYEAGEQIWFRAYLTNAVNNKPSHLSGFVYVELRDSQDSLCVRQKIAKQDSVFAGYLPLDDDLKQGDYFLRAYSYWMQNAGDEYLFRKKIRVMNPKDTKVKTAVELENSPKGMYAKISFLNSRQEPYKKVSVRYVLGGKEKYVNTDEEGNIRIRLDSADFGKKVSLCFNGEDPFLFERMVVLPDGSGDFDVAFMPEGGDLLEGCKQLVAFKAIGKDGLSRNVAGMVVDDRGEQVTYIQTLYKGMGGFELTAEPGRKYFAKVRCRDKEKCFALPESKREVIALRVMTTEQHTGYVVQASAGMKLHEPLYLVLHSRGVPLHCEQVKIGSGGKISNNSMPEGILHLVLVNGAGDVYSRRLCFIKYAQRPEIKVNTSRDSYLVRDSACLNICVSDERLTDLSGSFSVAITDDGQVAQDTLQDHILSYLLLTSELKGYVENPAAYFVNNQVISRRYLDLLMLTQGWTRFDISDVLKEKYGKLDYYVERGQTISGRVKNFWGKEAEDAKLILLGTNGTFGVVNADSAGHFLIDGIAFPDSTKFVIQGRNKRGRRNVEVVIDKEVFLQPTSLWPVDIEAYNGEDDFYKRFSKDYYYDNGVKVYVLDEAVVKRRMERKQYSFYDGMADYNLDSAKLASLAGRDIRMVLQEIPGVTVLGDSVTRFGKPLYILVNDFEERMDYVMRLLPEDLLSISFIPSYRSQIFFGGAAQNGAIVITTNPNFVLREAPRLDVVAFSLLGYQKKAEFYMPRYEVDSVRLALQDTIDMRKTVCWNPDVRTNVAGQGSCYFTTSDSEGPYTIIIEGILQDGTVCRFKKRIVLR